MEDWVGACNNGGKGLTAALYKKGYESYKDVECIPTYSFCQFSSRPGCEASTALGTFNVLLDRPLLNLAYVGVYAFAWFKGQLVFTAHTPLLTRIGGGAFEGISNTSSVVDLSSTRQISGLSWYAFFQFQGTIRMVGRYPSLISYGNRAFMMASNENNVIAVACTSNSFNYTGTDVFSSYVGQHDASGEGVDCAATTITSTSTTLTTTMSTDTPITPTTTTAPAPIAGKVGGASKTCNGVLDPAECVAWGVTACGLLVLSDQVNVTLTCQVLCDSCSDGVGGDAAAVVTNTSSMDGSTSIPPKTVVIVGVAFGTVCLLGVVVALIFLRLKSTANKDEVALRARMTNNMQHALDEQVHGNRIFDGGNNEDVDVNAGGGAPMPSAVYAEAMTHNEHYTYAPIPPPMQRQGALANVAVEDAEGHVVADGDSAGVAHVTADEPEYAMPQDDYAPLESGNTTYSSSA